MKNKALAGVVLAIILILFHVVLFAVPVEKNVVFWVSYAFTVAAILIQAGVCAIAFRKAVTMKSKFLGFPIVYLGIVYLAVQLILCAVFVGTGAFIPVWIPVVIYALILGGASVLLIAVEVSKDEISRVERNVEEKRLFLQFLQADIEGMEQKVSGQKLKTELKQFSETVRYSDPMSSEALLPLERKIEDKVRELKTKIEAGDNETGSLLHELNELMAERNKKCKILK